MSCSPTCPPPRLRAPRCSPRRCRELLALGGLLALCGLLAGCRGAHEAAGERPSSGRLGVALGPAAYFPLVVGTKWIYEAVVLGSGKRLEINMVRESGGVFEDSTGARFAVDGDGVRDERRYLLKGPLRPGTSWRNVVSVSAVERYEILSAGASCASPAGRWSECVVVESRIRGDGDDVLVNELTFAPGVGLVSTATVLESGGKRIPQASLRLLEYHPARR